MKFPNCILLDNSNNTKKIVRPYWVVRFLLQKKIDWNFAQKFVWFQTDISNKKLIKKPYKFTLKYSLFSANVNLTEEQKTFYNDFFKINPEITHRPLHSKYLHREIYDYLNYSDETLNSKYLRSVLRHAGYNNKISTHFINTLNTRFNLIYFRKEKIYTKLKYSRVPQYDAVSGGSAAILAGFLGYLITEKFGLELLDSGDFWFFFMYLAFLSFSCQPLLKIIHEDPLHWSSISPKWGLLFYIGVFRLFLNFIWNSFSWISINKFKM